MKETIIHPTALVEPGVELGQGVSVGPFCHIQSGAVIGDNSVLMSHVVVTGGTTLGAGAKVYPHAVLGCDPQNGKHKGGPTIAARTARAAILRWAAIAPSSLMRMWRMIAMLAITSPSRTMS
jgi:acyl-[acyl carrier protein]--UDP-N-acetylglucosamine O-acyltransferase